MSKSATCGIIPVSCDSVWVSEQPLNLFSTWRGQTDIFKMDIFFYIILLLRLQEETVGVSVGESATFHAGGCNGFALASCHAGGGSGGGGGQLNEKKRPS